MLYVMSDIHDKDIAVFTSENRDTALLASMKILIDVFFISAELGEIKDTKDYDLYNLNLSFSVEDMTYGWEISVSLCKNKEEIYYLKQLKDGVYIP